MKAAGRLRQTVLILSLNILNMDMEKKNIIFDMLKAAYAMHQN